MLQEPAASDVSSRRLLTGCPAVNADGKIISAPSVTSSNPPHQPGLPFHGEGAGLGYTGVGLSAPSAAATPLPHRGSAGS